MQIKNRYRSFIDAPNSLRWIVRFFFAFSMVFLVAITQKYLYPNSELAHAVQMQYELEKINKEINSLSEKIETAKRENTHWQDPAYAVLQARKQGLVRRFLESRSKQNTKNPINHREEVYELVR